MREGLLEALLLDFKINRGIGKEGLFTKWVLPEVFVVAATGEGDTSSVSHKTYQTDALKPDLMLTNLERLDAGCIARQPDGGDFTSEVLHIHVAKLQQKAFSVSQSRTSN